jgi:CRISPR/Cas system-associated endonuclease Cas1
MGKRSAYRATDPINSLLNLSLGVTAGRLTVALAAHGLSPAIGFIHKSPRWPLTYDVIELLRPRIERITFDFIDRTALSPRDFIVENGTHAVKDRADVDAPFPWRSFACDGGNRQGR